MINIYINGSLVAFFCSPKNEIEYIKEVDELDQLTIKAKFKKACFAFACGLGETYQYTDGYTNQTTTIVKH